VSHGSGSFWLDGPRASARAWRLLARLAHTPPDLRERRRVGPYLPEGEDRRQTAHWRLSDICPQCSGSTPGRVRRSQTRSVFARSPSATMQRSPPTTFRRRPGVGVGVGQPTHAAGAPPPV